MVRVGPAIEPCQRVQQMLRALNDGRPVRLLRYMNDAFHSQQVTAEVLLQCIEQEAKCLPRDRLLAHETERCDVSLGQTVMMPGMVVAGMIMMGVIVVRKGVFVDTGIQPGPRISFGVGRVEAGGTQQCAGVEPGIVDPRDACRRVQASQTDR